MNLRQLLEGSLPGTALIMGRFQPITVAHYNIINMARRNFQQVYVVIVDPGPMRAKKKYTMKGTVRVPALRKMWERPFIARFRAKLVHAALEGKLDFKNIITAPTGHVPSVMKKVYDTVSREQLKKQITVFTGTDRADEYRQQLKNDLDVTAITDVMEVKRDMDDAENVSASKVREAIANDNRDEFERLTPTGIHSYYNDMKKIIRALPERPINDQNNSNNGLRGIKII